MVVIGVDPHKSTHTATAVDPATNTDLGSVRIEATLAGYKRLIAGPSRGRSDDGQWKTPRWPGVTPVAVADRSW